MLRTDSVVSEWIYCSRVSLHSRDIRRTNPVVRVIARMVKERGEEIRAPGLLERYHIARNALGFDSCVVCAAQYLSGDGGRALTKDVLYPALEAVVRSHAALGVRLTEDELQPASFVRLETVDLFSVVEFLDVDDIEGALRARLSEPLPTGGNLPLWRVTVLKNDFVCFAWQHCIGDGLSGLAFHRSLLRALNAADTQKGDFQSRVVVPHALSLAPTIESVVNVSPPFKKVLAGVFDLFVPVSWTRGKTAWTGRDVPAQPTLDTRLKIIELLPDEASRFVNTCRAHGATLTSACFTLAISVLSRLVTKQSPSTYKTISGFVPMSLRTHAGTSKDVFCEYVSTLHSYMPIQPTFSWEDAAKFASRLQKHVPESGQEIGMLKYLFGRYVEYFRGKLGKKRQGGLELSNLGRFDYAREPNGEQGQRWSIGRTVFAQCDVAVGSAVKLNVVGDALGGVAIAITWGVESTEQDMAKSFASELENELRALCKST